MLAFLYLDISKSLLRNNAEAKSNILSILFSKSKAVTAAATAVAGVDDATDLLFDSTALKGAKALLAPFKLFRPASQQQPLWCNHLQVSSQVCEALVRIFQLHGALPFKPSLLQPGQAHSAHSLSRAGQAVELLDARWEYCDAVLNDPPLFTDAVKA